MKDAFGKEITVGAMVRYGRISKPREAQVVTITTSLSTRHVKVDGVWKREWYVKESVTVSFHQTRVGMKPQNLMVVDEARPAN